jgi:hypothetical protein
MRRHREARSLPRVSFSLAPISLAVPADREGLCGRGFCRHSRCPAWCWSAARAQVVVVAPAAEVAEAEAVAAVAEEEAAVAVVAVVVEVAAAAAEEEVAARAAEASAAARCPASTRAASRPRRPDRPPLPRSPQHPGRGMASHAEQPSGPEFEGLPPRRERRLDRFPARHRVGFRGRAEAWGAMRSRLGRSRSRAPPSLTLSGSWHPLSRMIRHPVTTCPSAAARYGESSTVPLCTSVAITRWSDGSKAAGP